MNGAMAGYNDSLIDEFVLLLRRQLPQRIIRPIRNLPQSLQEVSQRGPQRPRLPHPPSPAHFGGVLPKTDAATEQGGDGPVQVALPLGSLSDGEDLINEICKSAYFFQPYRIDNAEFKFMSSICKEAVQGSRKCKEPLIRIDHAMLHFEGKNEKIIIKDKPFLLTIESEPNSTIIYTNKPRTHPLLIFTEEDCGAYFKKRMNEKCSEMLTPPCDLSIIVIK
jgi:hypothetical protein